MATSQEDEERKAIAHRKLLAEKRLKRRTWSPTEASKKAGSVNQQLILNSPLGRAATTDNPPRHKHDTSKDKDKDASHKKVKKKSKSHTRRTSEGKPEPMYASGSIQLQLRMRKQRLKQLQEQSVTRTTSPGQESSPITEKHHSSPEPLTTKQPSPPKRNGVLRLSQGMTKEEERKALAAYLHSVFPQIRERAHYDLLASTNNDPIRVTVFVQ